MKNKVENWAHNEAERLANISNRQRDKFNTACVVYERSTGQYYFGRNNGININGSSKNSILFGDSVNSGILPQQSFNKYSVGNCAEEYLISRYPQKDWKIVFDEYWKITNLELWDEWMEEVIEIIPEYLFEFNDYKSSGFEYLSEEKYNKLKALYKDINMM